MSKLPSIFRIFIYTYFAAGLSPFIMPRIGAQSCGNTKIEIESRNYNGRSGFSSSCIDWADYHVQDEFDTPIKTIRLTFHIFQNAAGTLGLDDIITRSSGLAK